MGIRWIVIAALCSLVVTLQVVRLNYERSAILVNDQYLSGSVLVDTFRLHQPGSVVVVQSLGGKPLDIVLGSTNKLPPGTYNKYEVPLNEAAIKAIQSGDMVFIVLYTVDGEGQPRAPMRNVLGKPISAGFRIL